MNVGAAPAIDGLILVSDDADIVVRACEVPDQPVLHPVGILVFVHHDVLETRAVLLGCGGEFIEQLNRLDQQIVKIERVGLTQAFFIRVEDVCSMLP